MTYQAVTVKFVEVYNKYVETDPPYCDCSEIQTIVFTDPIPYDGGSYFAYSGGTFGYALPCFLSHLGIYTVSDRYSEEPQPIMVDGRVIGIIPTNSYLESITWEEFEPDVTNDFPMEGEGGVDVNLIAGYSDNYLGGWYASIEITSFNDALIPVNFQANPNRFNFGEISLGYHGFTAETVNVDRRKLYVGVHSWFPTLEPAGVVEPVSLWIPFPSYPRASEIKWGLFPSVKGTLRIWYMKLISGMDAYF